MNTIKKLIESRKATAAVIGLGYVGLPLAMEMVAAGFDVIGIDLDRKQIAALKEGTSYIRDVDDQIISAAISSQRFFPTKV